MQDSARRAIRRPRSPNTTNAPSTPNAPRTPGGPGGPAGADRAGSRRPPGWEGSVVCRWMLTIGAALAVGLLTAALLIPSQRFVLLWLLVTAAVFAITGAVRVRVSGQGVTVSSVVLPLLRRRVPLSRIRSASIKHSRPSELGGWGYRWSPGRTAVSLRAGDALWLDLHRGKQFVITVDDAATAAHLVNAHLAHEAGERSTAA